MLPCPRRMPRERRSRAAASGGLSQAPSSATQQGVRVAERFEPSGVKIPYGVDELERMPYEKMFKVCKAAGLKHSGKSDALRARLMSTLLQQKKAANEYLQKKANRMVKEIKERAEDAIDDWGTDLLDNENDRNMASEMFSLFDGIEGLEKLNADGIAGMQELDKWHREFQSIDVDTKEFEAVAAMAEAAGISDWDKILSAKVRSEKAARELLQLLTGLREKLRREVDHNLSLLEAAKKKEEELRAKVTVLQNRCDELERSCKKLVSEQREAEGAAEKAATELRHMKGLVKIAKTQLQDHTAEWQGLETDLRQKIEDAKARFAAEKEEARLKYEMAELQARADMETKIQEAIQQIEHDKQNFEALNQARVDECVKQLEEEGKVEVDRLTCEIERCKERIAALEAQFAEYGERLAELQRELENAERLADETEAGRDEALSHNVDPDIALFKKHHDGFTKWMQDVRGRTYIDAKTQADDPTPAPPVPPVTEPWFKPDKTTGKSVPSRSLEELGPEPRAAQRMLGPMEQLLVDWPAPPADPLPEPELEPEPEPKPEPELEPKPESESQPELKLEPEPEPRPRPVPELPPLPPQPSPRPPAQQLEPASKPMAKPNTIAKSKPKLTPTLAPPPESPHRHEPDPAPALAPAPRALVHAPAPKLTDPPQKTEQATDLQCRSPSPTPQPPKSTKVAKKVSKKVKMEPVEPTARSRAVPLQPLGPAKEKEQAAKRRQEILDEKRASSSRRTPKQLAEMASQRAQAATYAGVVSDDTVMATAALPPHLAKLVRKEAKKAGADGSLRTKYVTNQSRSTNKDTALEKEKRQHQSEGGLAHLRKSIRYVQATMRLSRLHMSGLTEGIKPMGKDSDGRPNATSCVKMDMDQPTMRTPKPPSHSRPNSVPRGAKRQVAPRAAATFESGVVFS